MSRNYYPTLDIGRVIVREFSNAQILQDMALRDKYEDYRECCLNIGIDPFSFDRWLMDIYKKEKISE